MLKAHKYIKINPIQINLILYKIYNKIEDQVEIKIREQIKGLADEIQ